MKINNYLNLSKINLRQISIFGILLCGVSCASPVFGTPLQDLKSASPADTAAFFERTHGALETALEMFDQQRQMPNDDDLAFYDFLSRTKESQQQKIEGYLEVAAEALGISNVNDRRAKISKLRQQIVSSRQNISIYQRKRISAPESTYNPLTVSQAGYDKKIAYEQAQIKYAEADIKTEKEVLVAELNQLGMQISPANVDILLESITGDEFVRISVIFDNAKEFARALEQLTEQTGEDLETAKKYYGVYLMLLKTIDQLQNKFIDNVDDVYYPQLDEYAKQAKLNIADARQAIRDGGNLSVLENNIFNNQITYDTAMFYKQSLAKQKAQMMRANRDTRKNILTAVNTYRTAALSKDLASLMAVSRRAFESISKLSVPDLRPFDNSRLKEEFNKLTREMESDR
ncbi:MAG: hypothetical protein MK106_01340 [Mariniblastus sp.]|nr:hypothetical protein [Mariniblastus sp.]